MPKWIWALFLSLVGLWVWQVFSEPRSQVVPSVESRAIDGLAAFAELIEAEGIRVFVNRSDKAKYDPDSLVIVVGSEWSTQVKGGPLDSGKPNYPGAEDPEYYGAKQFIVLDDHVYSLRDLGDPVTLNTLINGEAGPNLVFAGDQPGSHDHLSYTSLGKPLVKYGPNAVIGLDKGPDAVAVRVASVSMAMNGYIGKGDNARVLMQLVRRLLPKGGKVVFDESDLAVSQDNLLSAIHPSLNSAWNQVLLTFGVVVYTLGRRFGTLILPRSKVKTTSTLLLAFGNILRRANANGLVHRLLYTNIDARIRSRLNLAKDATAEVRNMFLSEEQVRALDELKNAGDRKLPLASIRRVIQIPNELVRR